MSELIKKLRIAARLDPPPMGFTKVNKAASKPKPILVARISGEFKALASLLKGADAVFVDVQQEEVAARIVGQLSKLKGNFSHGCRLDTLACKLKDFSVFSLDSDMSEVKKAEKGRVLAIVPEIEDKYLRSLDDLPIDAVMVTGKNNDKCRLTLQNYMLCHRLAMAVSRPLIIHISPDITAQDVEEMWDYGIDGVVVDIDANNPDVIQKFRKIIDSLEFTTRRKKISLTPIIPLSAAGGAPGPSQPEPDDDDDDDDDE